MDLNTQKEIALVEKQVGAATVAANQIVIADADGMMAAGELLKKIKAVGKLIKTQKEAITKPLNEGLKQVRAMFSPFEEKYETAEQILTGKMTTYTIAAEKEKNRIEQEAAAKLRETEEKLNAGKITEAQAQRIEEKVEQKLEKAPEVVTKSADFHTREVKKFRIANALLIPREYLVPDEVKIRKAMMAGVPVEGVEYYSEKSFV